MPRSRKLIFTLIAALLFGVVRCTWGWLEYSLAARQKTPSTAAYHARAETFFLGLMLSLAGCAIVAAWGALSWYRRK